MPVKKKTSVLGDASSWFDSVLLIHEKQKKMEQRVDNHRSDTEYHGVSSVLESKHTS